MVEARLKVGDFQNVFKDLGFFFSLKIYFYPLLGSVFKSPILGKVLEKSEKVLEIVLEKLQGKTGN